MGASRDGGADDSRGGLTVKGDMALLANIARVERDHDSSAPPPCGYSRCACHKHNELSAFALLSRVLSVDGMAAALGGEQVVAAGCGERTEALSFVPFLAARGLFFRLPKFGLGSLA